MGLRNFSGTTESPDHVAYEFQICDPAKAAKTPGTDCSIPRPLFPEPRQFFGKIPQLLLDGRNTHVSSQLSDSPVQTHFYYGQDSGSCTTLLAASFLI
jgi:hypothetical protein